jgi:hypothetical protein
VRPDQRRENNQGHEDDNDVNELRAEPRGARSEHARRTANQRGRREQRVASSCWLRDAALWTDDGSGINAGAAGVAER